MPQSRSRAASMGEDSSSSFIPAAVFSMYPLGPSGIPLIPCLECGDEVAEWKSRKHHGKIFFKCVKYNESLGEKKCPFFRWMEECKQEVAKKVKKDLKAAVREPSHGCGRNKGSQQDL
ncbi:hypothetical protein PVAP13_3NG181940 [Panicum virgatum]|uniref:Zinc finger GRF-type domain-containing protein n=1 Tax=Panicum virgatum TaxID=38727 RepID=A0A8T0U965_PANVG|nr:hypothetical protein PVAP13_3NG181940 [Panicum virgatum]